MIEIAIDIGGTFTDIVCLHDQQRLCLAKVPTTPHGLVQGVRQGVTRVLALAGQPATAVERFIHSTTIATNAILEHKGAITGGLMTAGRVRGRAGDWSSETFEGVSRYANLSARPAAPGYAV